MSKNVLSCFNLDILAFLQMLQMVFIWKDVYQEEPLF